MLDELGYPRKEFPLDNLLGIVREEREPLAIQVVGGLGHVGVYEHHNYIRIAQPRHPLFSGFEKTAILELHGVCYHVRSDKLTSIAHMVPVFPVYPPETSYMEDGCHTSSQPAILAGETGFGGRVVYFAADFDRRYGQNFFPDQGDLLKNAILWALDGDRPFTVEGPGELDCKLFSQNAGKRLVMQILNHSGLGKWPGSVEEFFPVGPLSVSVRVGGLAVKEVFLRNAGLSAPFTLEDGILCFTIPQLQDQELIVIQ